MRLLVLGQGTVTFFCDDQSTPTLDVITMIFIQKRASKRSNRDEAESSDVEENLEEQLSKFTSRNVLRLLLFSLSISFLLSSN
jgi:hypothetical protein